MEDKDLLSFCLLFCSWGWLVCLFVFNYYGLFFFWNIPPVPGEITCHHTILLLIPEKCTFASSRSMYPILLSIPFAHGITQIKPSLAFYAGFDIDIAYERPCLSLSTRDKASLELPGAVFAAMCNRLV